MSNIGKFQLPLIKGTDVFPETVQSPPVVRASVEFIVDPDRAYRPEVLEDRLKDAMATHSAALGNFVLTQRQNYTAGSVEFAKTRRSVPEYDVTYSNNQGRHELVNVHFRVDVRRKSEETVEEEEEDLMLVIFHDGNQISYAPMSELDSPNGTATRIILDQSNWGNEIIRTCQSQFADEYSAIYSGLNGLLSGAITSSNSYTLYDSNLVSNYKTDVFTKYEYPMMNGSGNTIHLPLETVSFNANKFTLVNKSIYTTPSGGALPSGRYSPFYISSSGDRHVGFQGINENTVGLYNSPIPVYIYSEAPTIDNEGYSEDNLETNPYAIARSELYDSGYLIYVFFPPRYKLNGSWISSATVELVGPNSFNYYGQHLNSKNTMSFQKLQNTNLNLTDISVNIEIDDLFPPTEDSYEPDEYITNIWGIYSASDQFEYSNIIPPRPEYVCQFLSPICWPPTSNEMPWHFKATIISKWRGYGIGYEWDSPRECELITPYGSFNTTSKTEIGLNERVDADYKSWLHISNKEHVLQGFELDDERYIFLNNEKVNSLLGVSANSIQSVLFDIPEEKIEEFK